jgi:ppGpp synthetase/RelA/SpoT-type nucleotidyltranferase
MSEYIYLAKIMYPYENIETMIGAYSTRERAENAIKKELLEYQNLTNRTDEEMMRIIDWIEELEINAEFF